jgi:hypothetical protein
LSRLGGDLDLLLGERSLDLSLLCLGGDLLLDGEDLLRGDLDLFLRGGDFLGDLDLFLSGDLDFYLGGEREALFSFGFSEETLLDFLTDEEDDLALTLDFDFSLAFSNAGIYSGLISSGETTFYSS